MGLKAEVVIGIDFIIVKVDVLHAASPLDGPNHISFSIRKALDARGGVLQGRGRLTLWVEVSAEYFLQVPIMNFQPRVGSHKQRVLATHVMDWLPKVRLSN